MKITATLLIVLFLSVGVRADLFLLHVGGDTWKSIERLDQIPANSVGQVARLTGGTSPPGDGGGNPIPPTSNRKLEVARITKQLITKKLEAQALLTTIQLFVRADDLSNFEQAMGLAVQTLKANLPEGNQVDVWWAQVKPLANGTYDQTFVKDLSEGVAEGTKALGIEQTAAMVAEAVLEQDVPMLMAIEEFNLGSLLQIIQMVLEILKNLGILNGG